MPKERPARRKWRRALGGGRAHAEFAVLAARRTLKWQWWAAQALVGGRAHAEVTVAALAARRT
jgi:hypothetical protein